MTTASDDILIVSGLPRSGTSMMMRMLDRTGIDPLVDHERRPDDDNPLGYYEFERVKKLPEGDTGWMDDAKGKVVKIISELLLHLPTTGYDYKVIFMQRAIQEVLASQRKMLVNRGEDPDAILDAQLALLYTKHLVKVRKHLDDHDCFTVHFASYNALLKETGAALDGIGRFLGDRVDTARMAEVIRPDLYRPRK